MSKYKRSGYVFITWKGDHLPRHVHVFRDGELVAKWDLDNDRIIEGQVNKRILKAIRELVDEGKI